MPKLFRKKEREKDRLAALADLSKLGNLGELIGLDIEEEEFSEEEDDVFGESYEKGDHTGLEEARQNSVSLR